MVSMERGMGGMVEHWGFEREVEQRHLEQEIEQRGFFQ